MAGGAFGLYHIVLRTPEGADGGTSVPENAEVGTDLGQKTPDFTLTSLEGEKVSLSDLRGKVVVLDFMATWCPTCRESAEKLGPFYEAHRDNDLVIISVDVTPGETESQLREFKEETDAGWTFALDEGGSREEEELGEVARKYKVRFIPTYYLVGREGIIKGKWEGEKTSQIEEKVEELL
ncbi:hypothetical protein AKJ63_00550 [candidate division MSBL1 archaeon SCGC-AAA259D18]|uniref:Thioredoxin domain-containing protein n=1 Tax=candidate division MSBL1 archaeon SCGC-AAA259D18 TaxID=1698262 RepID=A0A133UCG8_9EURY|nr:hypothetical protein AKJ63_00550 [candidate division MSBL1 archaeon SCGC-AAA259D18]